MDWSYFARGLVIGFSIAAPVGPIGVLCIRRTLADGRAVGFASGLGAATADFLYGILALFGLSLAAGLIGQSFWLRLAGGAFLLYLGVRTFRSRPAERPAAAAGRGLLGAYASTLFLTLTNPATILSFAAIFSGLGAGAAGPPVESAALAVGVFLGSSLWWLILSSGASLVRDRFTPARLVWVNRVSGLVIAAFGLLAFASLRLLPGG